MENEYMKRGYLLPPGCTDLIDVLKLTGDAAATSRPKESVQTKEPAAVPPITGEIVLPAQMTVGEIAMLLKRKPYRIVADLMEIGIYSTTTQMLDFATLAQVVRKYGIQAKRAV